MKNQEDRVSESKSQNSLISHYGLSLLLCLAMASSAAAYEIVPISEIPMTDRGTVDLYEASLGSKVYQDTADGTQYIFGRLSYHRYYLGVVSLLPGELLITRLPDQDWKAKDVYEADIYGPIPEELKRQGAIANPIPVDLEFEVSAVISRGNTIFRFETIASEKDGPGGARPSDLIGLDPMSKAGLIALEFISDHVMDHGRIYTGLTLVEYSGSQGNDIFINNTNAFTDGHGSSGNDIMACGMTGGLLSGGAGRDHLQGGAGRNYLHGGLDGDLLVGGGNSDIIIGSLGDDTIDGSDGDDFIHGGDGDDKIWGGFGSDIILGSFGDDMIDSRGKGNLVFSGMGSDTITAYENDLVFCTKAPWRLGEADLVFEKEKGVTTETDNSQFEAELAHETMFFTDSPEDLRN